MSWLRTVGTALAVGVSVGGVSCSSPARPSVSVLTGRPVSPAPDATLSYYSQPIQLTVQTGRTTTGEPAATVLEVATDAAFASIVFTKAVPASADGPATVTLDRLKAGTTYYWRVKTTAGETPAVVSASSRFAVGPQLLIQAPVLVQPLADSFPHKRPTFTVKNAARTGPPATLAYTFEIGADAGFTALLASGTVEEGSDQTSFTPGTDLVPGSTYFWRVRASDAKTGELSPDSPAQAFTTVFPDDGSYRYTLIVRAPSWCLTHFSGSSPCSPPTQWYKSDFGFDGLLVVEGDTLRYDLPSIGSLFNEGPFRLDIRRLRNRLTGSVSGTTADTPWYPVTAVTLSGAVSGEADNKGRFDGAVDGRMGLWQFGFPCDKYESCSTSGFAWTLLPR